jgi:hypothetical protein
MDVVREVFDGIISLTDYLDQSDGENVGEGCRNSCPFKKAVS